MPKPPTKEELMRDEKAKFRPWFIWTGILLFFFLASTIANFVISIIRRDFYITAFDSLLRQANADADQSRITATAVQEANVIIIYQTVFLLVTLALSTIFVINFFRALKDKDYGKFNPTMISYSILVIGFIFFSQYSMYSRLQTLGSQDWVAIISICEIIYFVAWWIFFWRKCLNVIRQFKMYELWQKQQELQETMLQGMKNQNGQFPFFPFAPSQDNGESKQPQFENNTEPHTVATENNKSVAMDEKEKEIFDKYPQVKDSKYWSSLKSLTREQMLTMAHRLNIFEPENLSDLELKAKITMIYIEKETTKSEAN
ncbi:hypothetical protein [Mycoplasma sp. 3341]|uniref:hypothetical protein n=1 Tax=Mycoplasma sp. 3341 TaxID=3447506 RepID=UPI003F655ABB